MMRYSEIPRDFSSDSLRFAELGEEQIYRSIRDESPPSSDVSSTNSTGPALPLINNDGHSSTGAGGSGGCGSASKKDLKQNGHYSKYYDNKDRNRRKHSMGASLPPQQQQQYQPQHQKQSTNGYCNYSLGTTPPNKTQSLPLNTSINDLDSIILSALRVTPEELANQITLLDFPSFSTIQPDELTSCAWTKKDKHIVAPNIVAFTKRFNHTSFWTVQEILSGQTPKHRAEILAHFIKVAKKLLELNNLHSLFSIISAMQTASIFRLKKSWTCLSKKDKQTFDRLAHIFSDTDNWTNLREYLESLKLPCIPYLGLFLTDLVYIDLAHPHSGGLESEQRRNKMNNILRVISSYQGSDYTFIQPVSLTQKYLQSIRYIEELQNIFEEDQYKKSLKLEPPSSVPSSSSCSSKESVDPAAMASLNLSPAKNVTSSSLRLTPGSATKFIPGHRKCRSLGSKFRSASLPRNFHQKCHCGGLVTGTLPSNKCKCCIFNKVNPQIAPAQECNEYLLRSRHLLDDSVIEDKFLSTDTTSTGSSDGVTMINENNGGHNLNILDHDHPNRFQSSQHHSQSSLDTLYYQGPVRRKTLLKDGKKPTVPSWQRYWLQIWANSLVYFLPKSFKGSERTDYKREPCKVCSLEGWSSQLIDNTQMNTFQLINTSLGTVYKFRTNSGTETGHWLDSLQHVATVWNETNFEKSLPPINLMTFE